MLLTLNDDCLYLVCKQLDVEDHISFCQTSKRLRRIVTSYYTTHNKMTLDHKIWMDNWVRKVGAQLRQEMFATFGSNIGPYIKEFSIKCKDAEQLYLLDKLPLDKISALILDLYHFEYCTEAKLNKYLCSLSGQLKKLILKGASYFNAISNHKYPNMTELHVDDYHNWLHISVEKFPALTSLRLHGSRVDVTNLCELKNLTTLDLSYMNLTQQHLQLIFGRLALKKLIIYFEENQELTLAGISKCWTLEELVLDDDDFSMHATSTLDELTKLRNLKRITIGGDIIQLFGHPNAVCKYLSLSEFEVLDLSKLDWAKKLEHLQHLKIVALYPLRSSEESFGNAVLKILMSCRSLRLFEIYCTEFDSIEILERMAQISRSIYGDRKETLLILCQIWEELLKGSLRFKNLSFPSFVKLSFINDQNPMHLYPLVRCNWQVEND